MIRLLERDSNARGALFARLVQDVFHALGYHEFRLGTPKAGRELDLWANHRVEARSALAECKATAQPIGGDAINKFAGALQMERDEHPQREITGYVVSLSGFRSSALAQEARLASPRVILLSSDDIERELAHARLIVAREAAIAGAIASAHVPNERRAMLSGTAELLAWEGGWAWSCRLAAAGDELGYVLVHADGQALGPRAAAALKRKDAAGGGPLAALEDLGPQERDTAPAVATITAAYLEHVVREYGDITVDGLPADEHVGSQKIGLEQLYVPLHLEPMGAPDGYRQDVGLEDDEDVDDEGLDDEESGMGDRVPIGEVLESERSIAVLGAPGAGKSTLLKRLAVAYADAKRRREIDDALPDRDWLPLVLRCRQLPADGDVTIGSLLASLPLRAEIGDPDGLFPAVVSSALADGDALVLIDGLDEISDDAARMRFARQLRTFIGTYPAARVVVTSREAGFRAVAGPVSDVCTRYGVAALDRDDIVSLTRAWHRLVVDESPEVERDAELLADRIYANARVRQLAVNPLLLTTLLLVRRWVGEVPRKRSALYEKAIEVLLMTWNIEGHEPIDLEEAIPQLAYVAYSMTAADRQSLSSKELRRLLQEAREELPEVLAYARTAPGTFIDRVEERSSLLSLSGHVVVDGVLAPLYEFKHLTFQEYLTAVACVQGFHPGASENPSLLELLRDHLHDSSWREVIPLALVLAGRQARPIVEALCETVEAQSEIEQTDPAAPPPALSMLAQTLIDEAMIPPALVDRACLAAANAFRERYLAGPVVRELLESRYGARLEELCAEAYDSPWETRVPALTSFYAQLVVEQCPDPLDLLEHVRCDLAQEGRRARSRGALRLLHVAFRSATRSAEEDLAAYAYLLEPVLDTDALSTRYAAVWAYAWLSRQGSTPVDLALRLAPKLLVMWRQESIRLVQRVAAWSFWELPLASETVDLGALDAGFDAFVRSEWESPDKFYRRDFQTAVLRAARIAGRPWSEDELQWMEAELNGRPT